MAVSRPSAVRQNAKIFPTPLIGDVLFYERVVVQTRDHPAYGTAHPNTSRWPNHILVFVKERTEEEDAQDVFDYYYAADRANQDTYNWRHTEANIEGVKFDAVERDYIIRRTDFNPDSPLQGAALTNIPTGKFSGSYVLAKRDNIESPIPELASIYVFERRTYVKRCSITTIETEDFFGIGGSKVDNWYYRGELVDGVAVETRFASPNSSYWGWQADGTVRDGRQISDNWFIISIISSITDTIDAYVFSYPSFTNINLPRRLVDTQLTFNVNSGVGNQDQEGWTFSYGDLPLSASLGLTDSCSSSVSISPEIGLTFEDPDGSYTPSTVYSFFLPQPVTRQDIIDRVSALHGSTVAYYTPAIAKTAVITLVSASASVRASATASIAKSVKTNGGTDAKEKSVSTDKSVGQSTQFVQISGFLGDLDLTSSQTAEVEATASMSIYGTGFAEGFDNSAIITDSASATASVTTSAEGGTEPSSNGAFITKINVEHYRFQRAKIFVEVVDL